MKILLLLSFIIIYAFGSFSIAQSTFKDELTWGNSYQLEKKETYPLYTEYTSKATYLISTVTGKVGLDITDWVTIFNSSSLSNRQRYKLDFKAGNLPLRRMLQFVFADKFYFLTMGKDMKENVSNFYLHEMDEMGSFSEPQLVASVKFGTKNNPYTKKGRNKMIAEFDAFKVVKSPDDKSLALVFPSDFDGNNTGNNQWNAVIYNDQLEVLEKADFLIKEDNIHLTEILLTNDRAIYALGLQNLTNLKGGMLVTPQNMIKGCYPIGSNYFFYHFDFVSKKLNSHDLSLTDQGVINASLKKIDEDIIIYGLTGGLSKKDVNTEGFFMKKMNLNGELLVSTIQEFDHKFYAYKSYHKIDDSKSSLKIKKRNFLLGEIFKNDKGDYVFLAEQYKYYLDNYGPSGIGGSPAIGGSSDFLGSTNNLFGDVVVINCSNDGVLNWTKRFFKSENYGREGDFLSSYFAQMRGNELYIVMNDQLYRTNEEKYDGGSKSERQDAINTEIISEIIIDENGYSERKLLLDINNDQDDPIEANFKEKVLAPKTMYLTKDGVILLFGRYVENNGIQRSDHFIRMGRTFLK